MFFDDPFSLSSASLSSSQQPNPFNQDDLSNDFISFERFSDFEGEEGQSVGSANNESGYGVAINPREPLNQLMFISMLEHICSLYTNDEEASETLFKMICQKLNKTKVIPNLSYLDEFKAVRMRYQKALKHLMEGYVTVIKDDTVTSLQPEKYSKLKSVASSAFTTNSWYRDMFTLEEHIATGGFGVVVKAKNKLDNKHYAIKKIPLVDTDIKKILQTLREVQIFSDLDHTNIVRYHSSWLEHSTDMSQTDVPTEKSEARCSTEKNIKSRKKEMAVARPAGNFGFDVSHLKLPSKISHDDKAEQKNEKENDLIISKLRGFVKPKLLMMTLYIQMELCHNTLRAWLVSRNSSSSDVDPVKNNSIFHQMLLAVHYIHNHGLMHRDLKPENVFLRHRGKDLIVKVGDFGLARYHPTHSSPITPVTVSMGGASLFTFDLSEQTRGVGTTTYAAPEQLKNAEYTNKVDIWSSGIILYELYQPFTTEMERRVSIQNLLKNRELTQEMETRWKTESTLLLNMTELRAEDRPSAQEALESISNDDKKVISYLQKQVKNQHAQILSLQKQLKENLCVKCKNTC